MEENKQIAAEYNSLTIQIAQKNKEIEQIAKSKM
jgi:hypothetical protein